MGEGSSSSLLPVAMPIGALFGGVRSAVGKILRSAYEPSLPAVEGRAIGLEPLRG
ncbi:hypothetical protein [Natronorubrum sp. DTA28]|uniref:hypothetical protein n=1 Tax=Natronorubrum sp. DTA28 TaxID=3447019 RepID=UPI003F859605